MSAIKFQISLLTKQKQQVYCRDRYKTKSTITVGKRKSKLDKFMITLFQSCALLLLAYCCCLILFLLDSGSGHRRMLALAQTTTTEISVKKNERYLNSSTTNSNGQLLSPQISMGNSQTFGIISNQNINSNQQLQPQPKSLKFTLIAGKYWKFNIKSNSFSSHKEGELRLHKNVSINNYIIDDESWFQYNPKQQLLFAWPSLFVKPGIYQFVLLPSGIDFEADSENSVSLEIAANIIVELIRPLYPDFNNDIDQLIDYKFSLDYLHRHSTYPLLLNQVIGVFDALAPPSTNSNNNNNNKRQLNTINQEQQKSNLSTTIGPITTTTSLLDKLKGLKPTNKLAEFLLINQSYSSDGEFFSLTWTTQASLINNTITQIQDCRLGTISDVIRKLSNLSLGYQKSGEDKYTLYYPLETTTAASSSQAIVSTERGQHLLKLNLNGPCKRSKVLDDLGIVVINSNSERSLNVTTITTTTTTTTIVPITIVDAEDKENSINNNDNNKNNGISDLTNTSDRNSNNSNILLLSQNPGLPEPEAVDSNTATPTLLNITSSSINQVLTTLVTTSPNSEILSSTTSGEGSSSTNSGQKADDSSINELIVEKVNKTTLEAQQVDNSRNSNNNNSNSEIQTSPIVVIVTTPTTEDLRTEQKYIIKNQPQAKSFANFLDSNDTPSTTTINSNYIPSQSDQTPITSTSAPSSSLDSITVMPGTTMSSNLSNNNNLSQDAASSVSITPASVSTESTLNEDFMGILNSVMDYLVSIAVPASIIIGAILIISIIIALCHLFIKRKKTKQFQVRNRFKFRYGSERRGFLKNSSKPVILDADRKSLSCGGTPMHHHQQHLKNNPTNSNNNSTKDGVTYLQMRPISSGDPIPTYTTTNQP